MINRILSLVFVFSFLLSGLYPAALGTAAAETDPIDQPYPLYFPLVDAGDPACQIVYQSPEDNAALLGSTSIVANWIIQNTSQSAWKSSSVTIRFTSGDRIHAGPDVLDMPYDVSPGERLDISVMMVAPGTPGSYISNWALVEGNANLCIFHVKIRVP